jgi:multimeric flavodoxin WrbA
MMSPSHTLLAIYGSPRAQGNTDLLLRQAVAGARAAGADVGEIFLRDLNMAPCVEDYGCLQNGRCVIDDDFQGVYDHLASCRGAILASPVFFCAVSAQTKILMDRCQSFWVRKNLLGRSLQPASGPPRKGLFISAAARESRRNFDGVLLSVRHFFAALDMKLWKSLLYTGADRKGDILQHPEALAECRKAGGEMARHIFPEI